MASSSTSLIQVVTTEGGKPRALETTAPSVALFSSNTKYPVQNVICRPYKKMTNFIQISNPGA